MRTEFCRLNLEISAALIPVLAMVGALLAQPGFAAALTTPPAFDPQAIAALRDDASHLAHDGYAASIWGGAHSKLRAIPLPSQPLFVTDEQVAAPMGLRVEYWPAEWESPEARPLVILFPATFDTGESPTSRPLVALFISMGYHVIAVPNPISPVYIDAGVKTQPLDFPSEAALALKITRQAIAQIGPAQISRMDLVGLSYGGFLAAVAAGLDAESPQPLFTSPASSVTLVSPPLNFGRAIEKVDQSLDETRTRWNARYEGHSLLLTDLNIALARRAENFSAEVLADSETLFANLGFRIPGAVAVDHYATHAGVSGLNPEKLEAAAWASQVRFGSALKIISPLGAKFLADPLLSDIGPWLARAQKTSSAAIRIVAAQDDPLSDPARWSAKAPFDLLAHTTLLPTGGHFGFVPTEAFAALIRSGFPPNPPDLY